MVIHWVSQTLDMQGEETEIVYYICHDLEVDLSFQITREPLVLQYRTRTQRFEFTNGYLTTITVFHETTPDVRVTLIWT